MSQQARNSAANARLVQAINALDTKAQSALAAAISALPAGTVIDDTAAATNKVWSSNKTQAQINAAITAIVNGAPGAQDTLAEVAAQITALIQADNGLLSFAAAQVLSPTQQIQACTNLGIGDPEFNYVTAINAALNAGL